MRKYIKNILSILALCAAFAPTAYAEEYSREVYIANSSFTDYLASWTYEGESVSTDGWSINGEEDFQLKLWLENSPKASAYKTLHDMAPGKYKVSAYVRGDGEGSAYMYALADGEMVKNSTYTSKFSQQSLEIDMPDGGQLEIGFAGENGVQLWYNADDVKVECIEEYAVDGGVIKDNSFENGLGDFSVNGAQISESGRTGNCLNVPDGSAAQVRVENIENGFYVLSAYCKSNNADSVITVSDGEHTASSCIPHAEDWKKVVVTGIYTDNGTLDVSVLSGGDLYIDDFSLVKVNAYREFAAGGDISAATYLEDNGAKYYDLDGNEGDSVKILADNGMNMARVRVYNQTGKATATDKGYGLFYLPDGYQDTEDALALCKRARENGMQIQFTFHYSDFWTNGERQEIPMEWRALIEGKTEDEAVAIIEEQVYLYTRGIMEKLKAQDTLPELVSIGNEIQFGMLYPYGYVGEDGTNWKNLSRFLNAGYRAVKEVSPSSRVILHLDDCGNFEKYSEFFGQCEKNNVNYDIIGTSYYPFWSQKSIDHAVEFCNTVTERFDKDIIIMETGYNFHPTRPDGSLGQLENNGVYEDIYPATPEGHKQFMVDLFNGLKSAQRCIGDLYWDPIMINCEGIGWAINAANDKSAGNVVSNTTLFDFDGKALPGLGVYENTVGADYTRDVSVSDEDMKKRFSTIEKNGRVNIKNTSDKDENIAVLNAKYIDGKLSGVDIEKRVLKPGESADFKNGGYTFVWTKDDIQPITVRK